MKSTVEQLNPTRVKMTVEVPFTDLEPDFKRAYESLAGQVSIPGFRPGKAPAKLIEARIGRGTVLEQVVNDMIPNRYSMAAQENELRVISQPDIDITKIEDNDVIEFTAEVDVRPDITVPDFSSLRVEIERPTADDEAVDTELDNLRARFGTLKGVERPVEEGDFLSIDLSAAVDGEPVEEASTEGLSYEVGSGTLIEGLDDAVKGLSEGESRDFTSSLMAGEHAGKDATITVKVQSVKERELPEADDDFAEMASEFDTLEELREDLARQVEQNTKQTLATRIRDGVMEALLEATDIPLPQSVVDSEVEAQMQQLMQQFGGDETVFEQALAAEGTDRETFESNTREGAERAVRLQMLMDVIAEDSETEVTQDEFTQHIMLQAQQYGMEPAQFLQQIQQGGQLEALFGEVRRSKALSDIIVQVPVTDSEGDTVDTEEFFGGQEDESETDVEDAEEAEAVEDSDSDAESDEKEADG